MKKSKRSIQIGLGACSILMIFVVLCMMILSVLSFNHAQQNEKIAMREVRYEEDYTKASTTGEILYQYVCIESEQGKPLQDMFQTEKLQDVFSQDAVAYQVDTTQLQVDITVNKQQTLHIVLQQEGTQIYKKEWKLVSMGGSTS